jgi:tRNA-dependent cyclodipeptide synthase
MVGEAPGRAISAADSGEGPAASLPFRPPPTPRQEIIDARRQPPIVVEHLSKSKRVEPHGTAWRAVTGCRLLISVGQPYHEGEKLKAVIDWVNRHAGIRFEGCEVIVGDTLHRFDRLAMGGSDAAAAHNLSLADGSRWLERNAMTLASLRLPHRVRRWDEIRADPRFPSVWELVDRLSRTDPALESALQADAETLLRRRLAHAGPLDAGVFTACCREYLIEELAGVAIAESDFRAATCYPGTWAHAWQAARSSQSPGIPAGLRSLTSVTLRIRSR